MSSQSPVVVLYSSDGYELAVVAGAAIPANTRGILIAGSDGTDPRFISTDTSGHIITVSNGATAAAAPVDADLAGATVATSQPSSLTNGDMYALSMTTQGGLRIDGVYLAGVSAANAPDMMQSGGLASTTAPTTTAGDVWPLSLTPIGQLRIDGVYVAGAASGVALDMMQVGALAATSAPATTTGDVWPLSMTTTGQLRIDSAYVVGTADATAADVMNVGGYATTAAPTYSSATLNPLSMDLSGNLRVIGSFTPTKSTTGVLSNVTSTLTNTVLLASNAARLGATFFNDSPTEVLYIALSTSPASLTQYSIKLMPLSYWELPIDYTGQINGIWNNQAGGAVRITELT